MRSLRSSIVTCLCIVAWLACAATSSRCGTDPVELGKDDVGADRAKVSAGPSAPKVQVEAILVQLERSAREAIEKAGTFKLAPGADQVVLSREQIEKLMVAVQENPGARIVAASLRLIPSRETGLIQLKGQLFDPPKPEPDSGSTGGSRTGLRVLAEIESSRGVMTPTDFRVVWPATHERSWSDLLSRPRTLVVEEDGQVEVVQELTYPTEYDLRTARVESADEGSTSVPSEPPAARAQERAKREVIAAVKLTPTVMKDGRIAIVATLEISIPSPKSDAASDDTGVPAFRTWTKTTSLILPDGSSFILTRSLPLPYVPAKRAEKTTTERQEILRKLNTVIPEVTFEDASLGAIVDYLSTNAELNIVMDPGLLEPAGEGPATKGGITVRLTSIPLKEVFRYVLRCKNLEYIVEDFGIVVVPMGWSPPRDLRAEIFRVGTPAPGSDERAARRRARESGKYITGAIKEFLRDGGIEWPDGSNLNYIPESSTLVVTNTPDNLASIRDAIRFWDDRDIHKALLTIICAKVVETK